MVVLDFPVLSYLYIVFHIVPVKYLLYLKIEAQHLIFGLIMNTKPTHEGNIVIAKRREKLVTIT